MTSPLPATPDGASAARENSATRLVVLLTMVASVGYLCRVDVTVVAPHLMSELHLSDTQMGTVFGAFLLGYTLLQVPGGWIVGRLSARALFFALALGWMGLTFAQAAVGRANLLLGVLPALLVLRFALGAVAAPTYPAAVRTLALAVAPSRQGRANGTVLASIGMGSAVAPPLLEFITTHWGWRAALMVAALLAGLAAVVWRWLAPVLPRHRAVNAPSAPTAAPSAEHPFRQRSFWALTASYTLQGYIGYVFVFWFFLYLVKVRRFELLQAAWLTTLPWVLSLAVIPLGGVVLDWAVRRWGSTRGSRSISIPALLLAAIALLLGAHTSSAILAAVCMTASTLLILVTEAPYWATMSRLTGPRSGTGGGVMNFGCNVGGMISPALTPWLAARVGWEPALGVASALAVASALLWLGVKIDAQQ